MTHTSSGTSIQPGFEVYGDDDQHLGTVADVGDNYVLIQKGLFFPKDIYVPMSAVTEARESSVIVNVGKDELESMGWDNPPAATMGTDSHQTMSTERERMAVHEQVDVTRQGDAQVGSAYSGSAAQTTGLDEEGDYRTRDDYRTDDDEHGTEAVGAGAGALGGAAVGGAVAGPPGALVGGAMGAAAGGVAGESAEGDEEPGSGVGGAGGAVAGAVAGGAVAGPPGAVVGGAVGAGAGAGVGDQATDEDDETR